jgi:beta-lactamase regulating signal transducer with metallopeptidase domain
MSWLHYLLEANIYLGVFYALYFLLLNKETYYKLNRAYLLCTPVLSYIIPLTQIGWLKSYEDEGQVVTTIIYNRALYKNAATIAPHFTLQNVLVYSYAAGVVVMLTLFIFKIFQLLKLTSVQKSLLNNKYKLVKVDDANTAFSFFNYVFIGTNVSGADTMIRHELVHIKQKHSVDIVFLELVKIINWFNPFIYLLQRSLKTLHEYIADEQTARYENDVLTYSSFLVSNAYGLSGSSISNSFFNYNLLKKRIIMLNQKRSGNLARLKYLAVIPVCVGLLCMSTLAFSKSYGWINILPANNLLSLQTPVTKKPDVLKSKNADTIIRLKFDTLIRLKLDTDKRIPPPPPPPKNVKSYDMVKLTNIKLSPVSSKNTKSGEAVILKLSPASKSSIDSKSGDPVAITNVKLAQVSSPSSDVKSEISNASTTAIKNAQQKTPPPPPPAMPPLGPFEALNKYVAKYTRYPTKAFENNLIGSIIVQFTVTNDHKLADISILKGIGSGCDEEVKRVVNAFSGTVNTDPGSYKLAVTYYLKGIEAPKTASTDLFKKDPSFAGEIVIMGYPVK